MFLVNSNNLRFSSFFVYKKFIIDYNKCENICIKNNGLAINLSQVGFRKKIFIIEKKIFYFFINSFLFWKSSEKFIILEGCLSLSKNFFKIRNKFIISYSYNKYFLKRKIFLSNMFSICFQHELDHSEGIFIG
ncbi:peptide deformylase [Candidatus Vidania fulgoroideorum]